MISRQEVFVKNNHLSSCAEEDTIAIDQPLPFYPYVVGYQVSTDLYTHTIRESVDSLCRDGADTQYMQYLSKCRITSPQIR